MDVARKYARQRSVLMALARVVGESYALLRLPLWYGAVNGDPESINRITLLELRGYRISNRSQVGARRVVEASPGAGMYRGCRESPRLMRPGRDYRKRSGRKGATRSREREQETAAAGGDDRHGSSRSLERREPRGARSPDAAGLRRAATPRRRVHPARAVRAHAAADGAGARGLPSIGRPGARDVAETVRSFWRSRRR